MPCPFPLESGGQVWGRAPDGSKGAVLTRAEGGWGERDFGGSGGRNWALQWAPPGPMRSASDTSGAGRGGEGVRLPGLHGVGMGAVKFGAVGKGLS